MPRVSSEDHRIHTTSSGGHGDSGREHGDGRGRSSPSRASSQASSQKSDGVIGPSVAHLDLAGGSGSAPTSSGGTVVSSHSSTGRTTLTIIPQGHIYPDDVVIQKSEKAKKCRIIESEGQGTRLVKKTRGSKSILQYVDKIEKHKEVDPSQCIYDAYSILHVNKDESYTDPRSEAVGRKVQELVAQQSQLLNGSFEPREVDMEKIYVDVVGGLDKKKKKFGVSGLASSFMSDGSSGPSQFHSTAYEQRLVGLENQLRMEQEERKKEFERMKTYLLARHKFLVQLCAQSGLPPPPPPPPL